MQERKSHLPQTGYFRASYPIPGTSWVITGHSRALERTGFWIPQLRCMLDAGIDLPTHCGWRPLAILVTHGHIDHCNALPMLLRHRNENHDPPTRIFAPATITHRLRQFAQLSWAVKVDIDADLPEDYAPPSDEEKYPVPGSVLSEKSENPWKLWHPCQAGMQTTLSLGKKSDTSMIVHILDLFHGLCSSVGFVLASPPRKVRKLRPGLIGNDKKETATNVQLARERGEEIHNEVEEAEKSHFAFVLDTTIDALMTEKSRTAHRILHCPVVMIECTYLEDDNREEARKRGHISWGELLPFVKTSILRRKQTLRGGMMQHQTWILVHFSLRYTEEDIVQFFTDKGKSKLVLVKENDPPPKPPDIVLWLDKGPKELWIEEIVLD